MNREGVVRYTLKQHLYVGLQIKSIQKMLAKNGITLTITEKRCVILAKRADPKFGARPVKRVIQRLVLNQLSKEILAQKVDSSHPIVFGFAVLTLDVNSLFRIFHLHALQIIILNRVNTVSCLLYALFINKLNPIYNTCRLLRV